MRSVKASSSDLNSRKSGPYSPDGKWHFKHIFVRIVTVFPFREVTFCKNGHILCLSIETI